MQAHSCVKCFNEEAKGITSKRQWETEEWKQRLDFNKLIASTQDDGTASKYSIFDPIR